MKQVLVLGAGLSASYLVAQLLEDAERQDWFVTVGDLDQALAREAVGFRGTFENGEFVGTHAKVSTEGEPRDLGTLTLRPAD